MSRLARAVLLAAVISILVVPSAANATPNHRLGGMLGDLWTTVLQTPSPDNPFNGGNTCIHFDDVLAPFGPDGTGPCTTEPGTRIFAVAWSTECSTFEGNGTTEAELRSCAEAADRTVTTHTITVDGRPVPVTEVETGLLHIFLPEDNIFGATGADRRGLSVGHGWVILLNPLTPGTHTITIHTAGSYLGQPIDNTVVTTIHVVT
jgi:hypothetical protein